MKEIMQNYPNIIHFADAQSGLSHFVRMQNGQFFSRYNPIIAQNDQPRALGPNKQARLCIREVCVVRFLGSLIKYLNDKL